MGNLFTIIIPVIVVALVLILLAIKKMIYICGPNEVLIFSGKRRRVRTQRMIDGKTVSEVIELGYRTIKGGRGFRIPMMERVDRIDLTNMIIEVSIANAYSKGGIPLGLHGVANVKIAGEEPVLDNAIERFLGKPRDEIIRIIRETLEGNLRGVLSTLTPEEVNEKKEAFVEHLQEEAIKDLQRLGVVVDTVKIQNVYDDVGYLNSIGRIRSAEIKKNARVAEAENKATAAVRDAENKRETTLRQIEVQVRTAKAEAEKRIRDAVSRRDAVVAEEKATVAAAVAKATAEIEMQEARFEQVKRQLEADVLQPARARANADQARAKGHVAKIIEDGRARAEAFRSISESWKQAGVAAKDMLLLQKLEDLLPEILRVCDDLRVANLTVLPMGDGGSVAKAATSLNEQLRAATGVDLAKAAQKLTGEKPKPSPSPTA
jgi:flotillin